MWALWDLNPRHSDVTFFLKDLESDILAELDQAPIRKTMYYLIISVFLVLNFAYTTMEGIYTVDIFFHAWFRQKSPAEWENLKCQISVRLIWSPRGGNGRGFSTWRPST